VIEGREPGAPSVTPDTGLVSRSGTHVPAGGRTADAGQAADLDAIRRSDAVIDMLASRRRLRLRMLRDPAIALLASLNADVDAPPRLARLLEVRGQAGSGRHAAPARWPGHRVPGPRSAPAGSRGSAAAAAAAAIATAAALVAAASLVIAAMLTRLTGVCNWDRSRGRPARPGRRY
jgi:hypothetical protein